MISRFYQINLFKRQKHHVKDTKTDQTINFEKRLFYQARKQKIQDVKTLANQLLFIRQENIKTMSDFDQKIKDIWKNGNQVKDNIKQLEVKYNELSTVYKELATYQEHKEVYDKYQKIKLRFNKQKFYDRHIGEINLAEGSLNVLSRYNIDPNTDLSKVKDSLQDINSKLQPLKREYKAINSKIDKIKEVKEYAEMVSRQNQRENRKINRFSNIER